MRQSFSLFDIWQNGLMRGDDRDDGEKGPFFAMRYFSLVERGESQAAVIEEDGWSVQY